jgi:isopentenyldiphosphate isomerase
MDHELLDVFDERGWHRGTKRRDAVHRDGDWHRAFHLWVMSRGGVLLQRRAATKAAWPGRLDATAAGHLLAGEAVRDGLREAEEELGVAYAFDDLLPLGVHRVDEDHEEGLVNRELQHVFAVRDDRPLDAWTGFDREEVAGLVLVGHDAFATLTSGDGDGPATPATPGTEWDGERERAVDVRAGELVPAPYLRSIAGVLARLTGA